LPRYFEVLHFNQRRDEMRLKTLVAALLAAGFVLPMLAVADTVRTADQDAIAPMLLAQAGGERFDSLDANKDGVIDREEAAALPELEAAYDEVDTAGDGAITPEEFSAWEEVQQGGDPGAAPQDRGQ
jgi:hypothetical protein